MSKELSPRRVPFAPPRIDQEMIDEVVATLKSGWITTGPKTWALQDELATYTSAQAVLCVNSATSGLELMLRWYGVGPGDEVIVPAYTYCATANVVVRCGAKPVMVDVGTDYNIDLKAIEQAISVNTKVIIPVDIAGWPSDYKGLMALVNAVKVKSMFTPKGDQQQALGRILVLGDGAHSIGAKTLEGKVGSLCDVTVFSFHAVKNLTTAEGGAICLNFSDSIDNVQLHKELSVLILHGQTKDARTKMQAGGWKYDVIEAGYKMNLTDLHAALGLVEIKRYDQENLIRRKAIWNRYLEFFQTFDWAELPPGWSEYQESSYHLFLLKVKGITEAQRDEVMTIAATAGIALNVHFQPLPRLTLYRELGYKEEDYPVAFDLYSRSISLPVYFDLDQEDQAYVCQELVKAVQSIR